MKTQYSSPGVVEIILFPGEEREYILEVGGPPMMVDIYIKTAGEIIRRQNPAQASIFLYRNLKYPSGLNLRLRDIKNLLDTVFPIQEN